MDTGMLPNAPWQGLPTPRGWGQTWRSLSRGSNFVVFAPAVGGFVMGYLIAPTFATIAAGTSLGLAVGGAMKEATK